jgi:hypothetical protein
MRLGKNVASQQKKDRRLNPSSDLEYAQSLEVVCASVALQQQPINSKSTTPAGYYGFDGGDIKAGTENKVFDGFIRPYIHTG